MFIGLSGGQRRVCDKRQIHRKFNKLANKLFKKRLLTCSCNFHRCVSLVFNQVFEERNLEGKV